jgi:hypothetical protein
MNVEAGIELYRGKDETRQGLQFDIAYIIQRLFDTFPGIEFEEEYFQRQTELVRKLTADRRNRGALTIALRDAEERGPRFGFTVRSSSGSPLKGGVNRHCLAFRFDNDTVDPELKAKTERFLASFELNRFRNESTEPSKTEQK